MEARVLSSLTFQNVSYHYDGESVDIIDRLSFTIESGSFQCIVGASGCGKSTIFHLINGLLSPKSGSILIDGSPIGTKKHYCGYMPQKDLLFPWRTVGENLALPLEIIGGYTKAQCRELIAESLNNVGLYHCHDKMPHELSGGMRQRAAFARTMLTGSDLLLLDEPFSALDFLTGITMQEWLLEQWEQHKKTIIFITHNVDEALYLSQRVLAVTSTPIYQLTSIDVPSGYPRSRESIATPEIAALRENLIQTLRNNVIL
ncbi:Bicarbonate transport ATP-binding protein CmpD [Paenibacillus sp. AD87]|nr:Bicarbonate transport ATP-binding protein CmpD [Paenibacillus sp. AD87]